MKNNFFCVKHKLNKKDQENIREKERTGNFSVQVVKYNYSCLISIHTIFYFKNVSVFPQVS